VVFLGSVYDKAYPLEHLDTILCQDKVLKLTEIGTPWQNSDFDKISEHNSNENILVNELVDGLGNHSLVDGLFSDLTLTQAEAGINYLKSHKFQTLLNELNHIRNKLLITGYYIIKIQSQILQ
jgi:hypothetical protein